MTVSPRLAIMGRNPADFSSQVPPKAKNGKAVEPSIGWFAEDIVLPTRFDPQLYRDLTRLPNGGVVGHGHLTYDLLRVGRMRAISPFRPKWPPSAIEEYRVICVVNHCKRIRSLKYT
jgi:hypothetical protein